MPICAVMADKDRMTAAIMAVAGGRATVRMDGERMGVVLDATGLSAPAR